MGAVSPPLGRTILGAMLISNKNAAHLSPVCKAHTDFSQSSVLKDVAVISDFAHINFCVDLAGQGKGLSILGEPHL